MRKPLLSFDKFISEQAIAATGDSPDTQKPETDREAKSRIAAGLVKSLFGGIGGLDGGIDSNIEATKEVKESLPYKGCGASEPFKLERTPISPESFKIILNYLQDTKAGDYTRSIKELNENRSIVIGIRNKINIKKESANQDRFCDALYFIPGGTKPDDNLTASAKESRILPFNTFDKISEAAEKNKSVAPFNPGIKLTPYQITTVPSLAYYGNKPLNPKGTGIKMPGDTLFYLKEYTLGHGTYKMMVEGEKVKVGRYPVGVTKMETYKPGDIYTENCGMEIHRSSTKGVGICIGPWSAGCQVFSDYNEFKEFISKAEKEQMNAGKFIYALIQLDDIPDAVMSDAMKGIVSSASASAPSKTDKLKKGTSTDINPGIESLSKLIKDEKEKMNSDEEKVINMYNSTIKSNQDLKSLLKVYGPTLWDDLDSFLSSSEMNKLSFR
jgi:hypothetical protein